MLYESWFRYGVDESGIQKACSRGHSEVNGSYCDKENGKAVYAGAVSRGRQADLVLALWPSEQSKALGRVLSEFVCDGRYREPELVLQYVGENGENLMESLYEELCEAGNCEECFKVNEDMEGGRKNE